MESTHKIADSILIVLIIALLVVLGYGGYRFRALNDLYVSASSSVVSLQSELAQTEEEKANLRDELNLQESRVNNLEEQIDELSGAVGEFEKLSKLDPELLQKYSKVYFLNENYEPPKLVTLDKDFLYDEKVPQQIHREVRSFLEDLIQDAENDDIDLFVRSAYRSFGTQATLKTGYTVSYGSGANTFSADQGYSEHQLGTTLDFTTTGLNGGLDGFGATPAYKWLVDNAYKYGFVLSYPQGNTFYQFEPWHWRFVGTDLSRVLHRKKINFYDMDQREIDKYLLNIFD